MEASRRQLALLGAIIVVLGGVLYWQSTRSEPTPEEFAASVRQSAPGAASVPEVPAAAPRSGASTPSQIPAVALASLDLAQPEPADSGRDPFRFESAPAASPRSGAPGTSAESPPPVQPVVPQGPPPITLKFIGIARQGAGRLYAVLRDERGVYYGAEGDVVEGRYRILRVSAETVDVSYVDGRGRMSIPLSGGRP